MENVVGFRARPGVIGRTMHRSLIVLALAACSGGGGSGNSPPIGVSPLIGEWTAQFRPDSGGGFGGSATITSDARRFALPTPSFAKRSALRPKL
jgi:hypothetical protein